MKHPFPVIIPYNLDTDNRAGQHILYRTTKDPNTLRVINTAIRYLILGKPGNPSYFNAVEAIVVTYNNIPKYGDSSKIFKYQVVITTDYTNTFAILNYDRLDESGNINGFSEPVCNVSKHFITSSDKTVLSSTSNVGISGIHIFLMTSKDCSS